MSWLESTTMWPHGSWRVVFTLSHWPRAMWWPAGWNTKTMAIAHFWPDLGSGLGVGLGPCPYLDPTRKRFLARKREQPTAPTIRATRALGELWLEFPPSYYLAGEAGQLVDKRQRSAQKTPPPAEGATLESPPEHPWT